MDVFELLKHYEQDSLSEKEQELFAYFAYNYGIENDENNHPVFYIRMFSKVTRMQILSFSISYKGAISYSCNICREKQPCYHFNISLHGYIRNTPSDTEVHAEHQLTADRST